MKRLFVVMCALGLSACASRTPMPVWNQQAAVTPMTSAAPGAARQTGMDANGIEIERVPFRAGVSSTTVEKMAHEQGCTGTESQGAGLMTPQGPVEIYRMICDSNKVFMARCEFRQCRPMSAPPPGGYAMPVDASGMTGAVAGASGGYAKRKLGARQVPKLVIQWSCGTCTHNAKVPGLVEAAYQKAAQESGYSVSDVEVAQFSIVRFNQRPPAMRILFGMFAGKDLMTAETLFRGQTVVAEDWEMNTIFGMDNVSTDVGTKTFKLLSAKVY